MYKYKPSYIFAFYAGNFKIQYTITCTYNFFYIQEPYYIDLQGPGPRDVVSACYPTVTPLANKNKQCYG